jgi:hypothetical protein
LDNDVDTVYNAHSLFKSNENPEVNLPDYLLHVLVRELPDKFKTEKIRSLLYDKIPYLKVMQASYREGAVELDNDDDIPIFKCLFDTGASHANYISKVFVDKHRHQLQKFIYKYDSTTTLD